MAALVSMKPALPLAKIIATVACRNCNIELSESRNNGSDHNVVIAWKYFPRYRPFVRGMHRSPVNSLHHASDVELWYFLWSVPSINSWVNNREAGDVRRHRAHYNIIVMDCLRCSIHLMHYHALSVVAMALGLLFATDSFLIYVSYQM